MGKYDRVLKDLPKLPVEHTDYQERVQLAKAEFTRPTDNGPVPLTPSELAERLVLLRRDDDALDEKRSALALRLEALGQLIVEVFEKEDLQSLKLASGPCAGASVAVQSEPYPGIADREAFRLWCLAQGMEREMHLHPSTAATLIKERLLNGDVVPCPFCPDAPGTSTNAEDGICPQCRGTGFQVAPGVRVFSKSKPVVRGR